MAGPQIIVTPNGEELVVLSRAEYDALVESAAEAEEDVADVAIYDARKAELAADRTSLLPAEVSTALMRGETLLKALRKWRKLSQIELAAATGLGQGYLSDLESGRRRGTSETLAKITTALDIDPNWLS
ncbi:MAG: helix-turn-helix domain-containing protein [Beijerinckiaceae bacterium]